jgi:hypothetical protein
MRYDAGPSAEVGHDLFVEPRDQPSEGDTTVQLILMALTLFGAVTATAQPGTNVDARTLVGTWVGTHRGALGGLHNTAELRITRAEGEQVFGVYRLDFRQQVVNLQRYYNNDMKCSGVVQGNSLYLKTELGLGNVRLNISSTDGQLTMDGEVEGQARAFAIALKKQ